MLSRSAKAAYYMLAGPLMSLNGRVYRYFRARRRKSNRVHLGPGQVHYISGWLNLDANPFTARADVWVDLRNPLPFPENALEAVYSHHVVEHLSDLKQHFSEVFRCLRPGGVYRVAGPNGDSAIAKFVDGDLAWFGTFPIGRTSIGGRFENFIFCGGEHLTILTQSFLEEIMAEVGFVGFRKCLPARETGHPSLFAPCLEHESEDDFEAPHTLVVEAVKP